jgi:hypothetical protein
VAFSISITAVAAAPQMACTSSFADKVVATSNTSTCLAHHAFQLSLLAFRDFYHR